MESSNGVAISDEKQFQIHGPCIPSCVPFIPTPNYPNRTVRVHFIATGEGGSQVKTRSRQFSTMSMVNNVPVMNVDHQEAVCPTRAQVCSWGSNVPFVQLLTCTDRSLAASLQTQIDNSSSQQHQPHSANLSPHTSQNHFLQMPQNGFPVQHINSNGSQSGKSCDQEKTGFDGNAYEENNTATDTPLQQHDSVHTSNPIVSNNVQDSQPVLTNQEIDSPVKNNEIEANSNIDLNKTPVQQKKRRRKHRPKVVVEGKAKRTPKPVTPKETNKEAPPGKRKYTRRAKTMESTTSEDLRMPTNTSTGGPISDNPGEDARLKEAFTSMFTNSNLVEVRVEDRCTIMTPAQQERPQSSATPSSEFKENVGISREASRKSCRRSLNFSLECQTEHMGTHSSAEDRHLPNRHIEGPFDLPESDLRTYSQNRDCREFNIFPGTRLSLPPVETVHALLSEPYPNTGVDSTLHLEEELGLVTDKSSGLAFDLNCCYTQHDHCSALPQFSIISSQNSTESLVLDNQLVDPNVPCLESSSDVDYSVDNHLFPSFTELLTSQILGGNFQDNILHDENGCMLERVPDVLDRGSECMQFENRNSCFTGISDLNGFNSSSYGSATHPPSDMHTICCSDCQLHPCEGPPGMLELLSTEASGEGTRCHSTTNGSQSTEVDHISFAEEVIDQRMKDVQSTNQQKLLSCNEIVSLGELNAHESNSPIHESHALQVRAYHEKHSDHCNSFAEERTRKVSSNDNFHGCSESDMRQTVLQGDTKVGTAGVARPPSIPNDTLEIENFGSQPFGFNQPKRHDGNSDVPTSLNLMDNQLLAESTGVDTNSQVVESKNQATEINGKSPKVKKAKRSTEKKDFDWDSLRRDVCCKGPKKERTPNRMDSLDWEAVRCANVSEIADTIRARGMNNMLAGRIKDFLNRVVADHGSINLEWLRDIPPEKAKDYLLSIRGLGLKSVECVRLLTLHHLAFPVDTNVGRICVRLGWVPLQPLPESLQLHLLELYPILETIQKYLWPRLCTLDQRTLYELHYQMITFGKVFCTKSKPNCNACPMRAECRHFASAFASARLALPGPEEKSIVSLVVPASAEGHRQIVDPLPLPPIETNAHSQAAYINKTREPVPLPLPPIEINAHSQAAYSNRMCEPIIEEPPEPPDQEFLEGSQNEIQASEKEIEDTFWQDDPDEIPTIKLNIQEFAANVQTYIEQSMELLDGEMSKALVALTPEVASIPMPKLKNVSRLRTEHQVYELPDSHPLLAGLDRREPDDPCSYLLAIWTPGETVKSTEQPETCCNSDESGNLCDSETCFTCNSVREARAQTVRGTLLIPCRTAMRGSFPLNGTYFQVNEVFADHDSSLKPIDVPRSWIWNLPRRTVYFGTSIPTIFRGLTTEGIQHCFWRGFVCVRGFDQRTRAPRPLIARLHFPASKIVRARKTQPNLNE